MDAIKDFELPKWIEGQKHLASVVAAGSTGPPMTLTDLKSISSDPNATSAALDFNSTPLHPSSSAEQAVVKNLVQSYIHGDATVKEEDIYITNGTTGANTILFLALLKPSDHIICSFPAYSGLVDVPKAIGAEISYLHLKEEENWDVDVQQLKSLIRPTTKMIVLNNPHNPCGSVITTEKQRDIIKLAAEHDIIIFCDEIFRPLYHTDEKPASFIEHSSYDRVVVTGSLSKAWGFPGVRIGWIATRNAALRERLWVLREWILQDVSVVDCILAAEILSQRCSRKILEKNVGYAQENRKTLARFVEKHGDVVSCVIPAGGATCFPKFFAPRVNGAVGGPVDDREFCSRLLKETGLLLSPATKCFGAQEVGELRGHMRFQVTISPSQFNKAIEALEKFVGSESYAELRA